MSDGAAPNLVGPHTTTEHTAPVSASPPFVTRLRAQNYKSIKACDVELGPLAILVGPNGSGKSNVLDTLRFTTDALSTTLDHALRDRGGIREVRRRSGGHPNHFAIRIDFRLPDGHGGHYSFRIGAQPNQGFQVTDEEWNMSDGTLRCLGVLVALLQSNSRPPTLVGIEEPEVALHPAAVGILIDAIRDAAMSTQVLVTSHSSELLDRDDLDDDVILAVSSDQGVTTVGPVNDASREALRSRLFTAGELLRMNQLSPSPAAAVASRSDQLRLFDTA